MKRLLAFLLALVMILGLIACSANKDTTPEATGETPAATEEEAPTEDAPATEDADGKYTLKIASIPADVVVNYINMVADSFREKYPEFQVEIVTMPYADYVPQAPRILGSEDNGFDLCWIQREQHWKSMADDGMFMVINDLYEEGDWVSAIGEGVANLYKNADGDYVGVCDDFVWIGNTYYNTAVFNELNLSVPTTYDELVAVCDALLTAGYVPMASSDPSHLFNTFAERFLTVEEYDAWCDPATAASVWQSDSMKALLEEFCNFSSKYLQAGNELSGDQAAADLFVQGTAAMLVGINALEGNVDTTKAEGFEYGYFAFPNKDRDARVIAFAGNSMEILASTDQPELAKEFLAHYMSVEMQSALAESGWLWPSRSDLDDAVVSQQTETRQQQVSDMSTKGTVALAPMRMSAAYTTTYYECLADTLVGNMSVEDMMATMAASVESE